MNWKHFAQIFLGITLVIWIYISYETMESLDRCEQGLYSAEKKLDAIERERDSLLLCNQYEMYYE